MAGNAADMRQWRVGDAPDIDAGDEVADLVTEPAAMDRRCVSLVDPDSYEAGHYLRLRWYLGQLRSAEHALVVAVSSPGANDGKSLTSINLAGALARDADCRVLLMDVDLRRKSEALRRHLSLAAEQRYGLGDLLVDRGLPLARAVYRIGRTGLSVVCVGDSSPPPFEALSSQRFGELVAEARNAYDYVILDGPPAVPVPDCRVLSRWVDGFVMVVSADRTPKPMVAEALRSFDPDKLLGLVLNRCDQLPSRYYRYYGHYGYARSASQDEPDGTVVEEAGWTSPTEGTDTAVAAGARRG